MRNLILTALLMILSSQTIAQVPVRIKVQLDNFNPDELVYVNVGGALVGKLEQKPENRSFLVEVSIQELPTFISFNMISKRGKITSPLPRLWFGKDTVRINIDWLYKSFQSEDLVPYHNVFEKIESLSGSKRIDYILRYPNQLPAMYYADLYKGDIPLADMETFMAKVPDENRHSNVARRLANYLNAKQLADTKIGGNITDFSLPDKEGNLVSVLTSTNKPKLITVFSSSCHDSMESIALMEEIHQLSQGKIDIITIWTDPSRVTWLNNGKEKKEKITWTNLWDEFGFADTYLDVKVLPSYYVVNETGVLTNKFHISKSTEKKLKRLIE